MNVLLDKESMLLTMNNSAAKIAIVSYDGNNKIEIPAHQSRTSMVKTETGLTVTAHTSDSYPLMVNNRPSIILPAKTKEPFHIDISVPRNRGIHLLTIEPEKNTAFSMSSGKSRSTGFIYVH